MGSSFYDDLFMREVGIKELYVKVLGSTVRDNLSTVSRERLLARKVGSFSRFNNCTVEGSCLSAHAACSFVEHPINLTKPTNKVFASSWLTPDKVVFGTKCNKLIIYDIHRRESMLMDMLCSSGENVSDAACGIHAIDINPSHTMLATGAKSPFEVGIYRLPTFEPVTVGVGAHTDWIFDMEWLDDSFLATCCRDGQIALWKFSPYAADEVTCGHVKWSRCINKNFPETSCVIRKRLVGCEKIRSLTYSYRFKVLVTVSLNSFLHVLDVETFSQVRMDELKNRTECVCICSSPCENLVAIGCLGSFVIYDLRDGHSVKFKLLRRTVHIPIFENDQMRIGVRSISWRDDLITIGTGAGEVLFFDTRTRDFLFCDCDSKRSLVVGPGWQFCDETIMEIFRGINIPNAVYTHCYDSPGSKLFVAGGPISAAVVGNYAAVFQ